MNFRVRRWLPGGALIVALALSACGPSTPSAEAPTTVPTTAPAQPTAAPAQPTTAPAQPTTAPTQPTAAPAQPTSEPIPTTALPNDVAWIRVGDSVYGDDEQLDFRERGLPLPGSRLLAAPNGGYIAYASQDNQLVVIDALRFSPVLENAQVAGLPIGFAFSPDGRSLAVTTLDQQNHWQLQVLDLAGGPARILADGQAIATSGDDLPLVPMPIAWRANGLFVQNVLWASDALPQGLTLIDPASGATQVLRKDTHIAAYPSPSGGQVALVIGELRIGEPPTAGISILDLASGQEQALVPVEQRFVKQLRWSPDGARLLYASSISYESGMTTIAVQSADGANAQALDVGISGALRDAYADAAWLNDTTMLLLTVTGENFARLDGLPLAAFDVTGLQPLGATPREQSQPGTDAIVYTPRA